jgi:hypothetical protein
LPGKAADLSVQMNALLNRDENSTFRAMETLIARDGFLKVVIAFVALLARRKRKARQLYDNELSEHMRRDLGLPPMHDAPNHWELR